MLTNSLTEDAVIADSGAYSYGMAYSDVLDIQRKSPYPTGYLQYLRGWVG